MKINKYQDWSNNKSIILQNNTELIHFMLKNENEIMNILKRE